MVLLREAPELGIPDVKPAIESVRGRRYRKLSASRRHSLLQARLCAILTAWAGDRGEVGTDWRCYVLSDGESPSSLVPDVAYFSSERMDPTYGELREKPTVAPDIAVEVLSPGERMQLLETKIGLYLANGSRLVVVADAGTRSVTMHEWKGTVRFVEPQCAVSVAFAGLRIETVPLFARL